MRVFFLILVLITVQFNFAHAQNCPSSIKSMTDNVFSDKDYKSYICGERVCDLHYFASQLNIDCAKASRGGDEKICFVTPNRKARNYYTGVFIIIENNVKEQFIFFGSGIGKATSSTKGFFDLKGVEIQDPGQSYETIYRWSGEYYKETSGNEVDWK